MIDPKKVDPVEREIRQFYWMQVGKIQREVISVLALETEQLKGYLAREIPNVPGAVRRIKYLEELLETVRNLEMPPFPGGSFDSSSE